MIDKEGRDRGSAGLCPDRTGCRKHLKNTDSSSRALHSARFPLGLGNDVRSSYREEKAPQDDGGGCTLHFHCSQNRKRWNFVLRSPSQTKFPPVQPEPTPSVRNVQWRCQSSDRCRAGGQRVCAGRYPHRVRVSARSEHKTLLLTLHTAAEVHDAGNNTLPLLPPLSPRPSPA